MGVIRLNMGVLLCVQLCSLCVQQRISYLLLENSTIEQDFLFNVEISIITQLTHKIYEVHIIIIQVHTN